MIVTIEGNRLNFYSSFQYETAIVSIFNENNGWTESITDEKNFIILPLSSGNYIVEVYLIDGRIFSGILHR